MATPDEWPKDAHMSVKIRRASEMIRRMAPEDQIHLLVEAGLPLVRRPYHAIDRAEQPRVHLAHELKSLSYDRSAVARLTGGRPADRVQSPAQK